MKKIKQKRLKDINWHLVNHRYHMGSSVVVLLTMVVFVTAFARTATITNRFTDASSNCTISSPSYCEAVNSGYPRIISKGIGAAAGCTESVAYLNGTDLTTFPDKIHTARLDQVSGIQATKLGDTSNCSNTPLANARAYKKLYPNKFVFRYENGGANDAEYYDRTLKPNTPYPTRANWPGYFMLQVRSNVTSGAMTAGTTSVTVSSGDGAAKFTKMYSYRPDNVVIWDDTGSTPTFSNYEYAQITGVSGDTLTLTRGLYGTTAVSHIANARIAVVSYINKTDDVSEIMYNHSTIAPVDSVSGKRANAYLAEMFVNNFMTYTPDIDGYSFDAGNYFAPGPSVNGTTRRYDCDADGVADDCTTGIGTSNQATAWGEGYNDFLESVRSNFQNAGVDKIVMSDEPQRSTAGTNGSEFESFPNGNNYDESSLGMEALDWYTRDLPGRATPRLSYTYTKDDTKLYCNFDGGGPNTSCPTPAGATPVGSELNQGVNANSRQRFGLVASTLFNGSWHTFTPGQSVTFPFIYPWDEDVGVRYDNPSAATRIGYLGQPTSATQISTHFTSGNLASGSFESGTATSWAPTVSSSATSNGTQLNTLYTTSGACTSGNNLNPCSLDSAAGANGTSKSLKMTVTRVDDFSAGSDLQLRYSGNFTFTQNAPYTLRFWAKVESGGLHDFNILLRGTNSDTSATGASIISAQSYRADDQWHLFTVNFIPTINATAGTLYFQVGREPGTYWFDEVELYTGNADIYTRTFDNGMVVLNDGFSSQTVTLPGQYKKIDGTQDSINDGKMVSSVTIGAKDALVLLSPASTTSITSISPNSGSFSGGKVVTIHGHNFVSGASVTVDGVSATNISVTSSTTITATMPAHAIGTADVTVTNPGSNPGYAILPAGFTYSDSAPSGSIVSPNEDDTVAGTVSVQVTAADDNAVAKVEFYVDGNLASTDTTENGSGYYTYAWDTTLISDGDHILTAKIYDDAATPNVTTLSNITVHVQNAVGPSAPATPSGLHTTSVTATSIALAWTANDTGDNVTRYNLYRDGLLIAQINSPTTSYNNTGLVAGTTYTYQLSATNAQGTSGLSSGVQATTDNPADTTPPSVPANLTVTFNSGTGHVDVTWDASSDDVGVASYSLKRGVVVTSGLVDTSFEDTSISEGQVYTYYISARDAAGNASAYSTGVSITVPDITPPAPPANLASTYQDGTVLVTWDASTDNVGVSSYTIMRNGSVIATGQVGTSFSDSSLSAGTTYVYTIVAVDGAGNASNASSGTSVTIPSDPSPPTCRQTDLNCDGAVNIYDLSILLARFGQTTSTGDVNRDGKVDIYDLSILLAQYGS